MSWIIRIGIVYSRETDQRNWNPEGSGSNDEKHFRHALDGFHPACYHCQRPGTSSGLLCDAQMASELCLQSTNLRVDFYRIGISGMVDLGNYCQLPGFESSQLGSGPLPEVRVVGMTIAPVLKSP